MKVWIGYMVCVKVLLVLNCGGREIWVILCKVYLMECNIFELVYVVFMFVMVIRSLGLSFLMVREVWCINGFGWNWC